MKTILMLAAMTLLIPINSATSAPALSSNVKTSTPEAAAKGLYAAWKKGDRPAARRVASSSAVNQLFKTRFTKGAQDWQFQGCEKRQGGYDCSYYYEGGGATMRVTGGKSAGYRVQSVKFIAD